MKFLVPALFLLLSLPASAALDKIEVDAQLISRAGDQMTVKIGRKRLELPASREVATLSKGKPKGGKIRVSVLPRELGP